MKRSQIRYAFNFNHALNKFSYFSRSAAMLFLFTFFNISKIKWQRTTIDGEGACWKATAVGDWHRLALCDASMCISAKYTSTCWIDYVLIAYRHMSMMCDNAATKPNVNNTFSIDYIGVLAGSGSARPELCFGLCVAVVASRLCQRIRINMISRHRCFSCRHCHHYSCTFTRYNQMSTVIKWNPIDEVGKLIKSLTINSNSEGIIENESIRILSFTCTHAYVFIHLFIRLFKFNRLCFVLFSARRAAPHLISLHPSSHFPAPTILT